MLYSNTAPPPRVSAPDYRSLVEWWRAWPEARPECLDFWARGGFMQRVLWRRQEHRRGLLVRVNYIDELECALKRLALLDVEIDFLWTGEVAGPALVMAPQDIDFEGVGGWGYITCSGDEFADRRSGREWCPTLAFATLLPDNVTDWLAEEAVDFTGDGRVIVCPFDAVGAPSSTQDRSERRLQQLAASSSIVPVPDAIQLVANIELPVLDGMSIGEVYRFCQDYEEELKRLRRAVADLVVPCESGAPPDLAKLIEEAQDAVYEIRSSAKTQRMRDTLLAAGGILASYQLGVSVTGATGLDVQNVGQATGSAAVAALTWWFEKVASATEMRREPFWILWKLQGGKRPASTFRTPRLVDELGLAADSTSAAKRPRHWLAPPSGGWDIPTGFVPAGPVGG